MRVLSVTGLAAVKSLAGFGAAATSLDGVGHRGYHTAMSAAWQAFANDAHTSSRRCSLFRPVKGWGRAALQILNERRSRLFRLTLPAADDNRPSS